MDMNASPSTSSSPIEKGDDLVKKEKMLNAGREAVGALKAAGLLEGKSIQEQRALLLDAIESILISNNKEEDNEINRGVENFLLEAEARKAKQDKIDEAQKEILRSYN